MGPLTAYDAGANFAFAWTTWVGAAAAGADTAANGSAPVRARVIPTAPARSRRVRGARRATGRATGVVFVNIGVITASSRNERCRSSVRTPRCHERPEA